MLARLVAASVLMCTASLMNLAMLAMWQVGFIQIEAARGRSQRCATEHQRRRQCNDRW